MSTFYKNLYLGSGEIGKSRKAEFDAIIVESYGSYPMFVNSVLTHKEKNFSTDLPELLKTVTISDDRVNNGKRN